MPNFRTVKVIPISYDGHAINDGTNYLSWLDGDSLNLPPGQIIQADVDFDWPYFVGNEKTSRTLVVHIQIQDRSTWQARINELNQWFSTQSGQEQYLLAMWTESQSLRRIACRPIDSRIDGLWYSITLRALRPYWEANEEESQILFVSADGDSTVVVNSGNLATTPIIELTMTTAPVNTWLWRRNVLVTNGCSNHLINYPLELTAGGWDTAALVANASKATTLSGAHDATTTTINVASTAAFYSRGLIYIDSEQIFYAAKTDTSFTGCIRGVGGTTAAGHNNGVAVRQSEMYADGRDVRVELDGQEVPHWFGAAMGVSRGPNYNNTLLWTVIPRLEALNAERSSGFLLTLGRDLARFKAVTTSSALPAAAGACLVDGNNGTNWVAATISAWAVIDLAYEQVINRVMIFHPNSADAPADFNIQTSLNGVDWFTRASVTGNTARQQFTSHDFPAVAARYVRINVSAVQTGGTRCAIGTVSVYHAVARLVVKYGNWDVVERTETLDTKPMFRLDTSSNTTWSYNQFWDARYPSRPAQWTPYQQQGTLANQFRLYKTTQDGAPADPATVMGIARATASPYYDAYRLHHPGGISQVVHSGQTRMNSAYRTWRLGTIDFSGNVVLNRYENTTNSPAAWTTYGPVTTAISPIARTVFIYMFHKATTTSSNFAQVNSIVLSLTNTPIVNFQAAIATLQLSCILDNVTTEQSFILNGLVNLNQTLEIDCSKFTVINKALGISQLAMLSLPMGVVRIPWMQLQPGTNNIVYRDTAVTGITLAVKYRSRWL